VNYNPITGNAAEQGIIKPVTGTDPAANAEISETVPAGKWWQLLAVSVVLVQGITQTPQPMLTLDDGTNVFYASSAPPRPRTRRSRPATPGRPGSRSPPAAPRPPQPRRCPPG
jgi:hypothetical protein